MTEYAFQVHQGEFLGTAAPDWDLVWARLIAGKAVARANTERRDTQGNPTHPLYAHLARKMVAGETIINRDDPDMPMQVHKSMPRIATSTLMTEEAKAHIPLKFRLADGTQRSTKYNADRLPRAMVREMLTALDDKLRKPQPPHASFSPEAAFARLIQHYNRTYLPLRAERDLLSRSLSEQYAGIADTLGVDPDEGWTLTHTATGLVIEVGNGMRSMRAAMSLYRRHLINTQQRTKLVEVERRQPSRMTISHYKPNPEVEAERAGLAAYGD